MPPAKRKSLRNSTITSFFISSKRRSLDSSKNGNASLKVKRQERSSTSQLRSSALISSSAPLRRTQSERGLVVHEICIVKRNEVKDLTITAKANSCRNHGPQTPPQTSTTKTNTPIQAEVISTPGSNASHPIDLTQSVDHDEAENSNGWEEIPFRGVHKQLAMDGEKRQQLNTENKMKKENADVVPAKVKHENGSPYDRITAFAFSTKTNTPPPTTPIEASVLEKQTSTKSAFAETQRPLDLASSKGTPELTDSELTDSSRRESGVDAPLLRTCIITPTKDTTNLSGNESSEPPTFLPKAGSLCRVYCKATCFFSDQRLQVQDYSPLIEQDWFPATIEKVTWNPAHDEANIQVRFFDESTTTVVYQLPLPQEQPIQSNENDFEMLVPVTGSLTSFKTIWSDDVFFDRDPSKAQAGDKVQAFSHNGPKGTSGAWYTGRIAHVRSGTTIGTVCDILYNNGNYETNIPLSTQYVHLLQKGWNRPDWLLHLPVPVRQTRQKRSANLGVVQKVTARGPVQVAETNPKTKQKTMKSMAYMTVVQLVMNSAVQNVPREKVHKWLRFGSRASSQLETSRTTGTLPEEASNIMIKRPSLADVATASALKMSIDSPEHNQQLSLESCTTCPQRNTDEKQKPCATLEINELAVTLNNDVNAKRASKLTPEATSPGLVSGSASTRRVANACKWSKRKYPLDDEHGNSTEKKMKLEKERSPVLDTKEDYHTISFESSQQHAFIDAPTFPPSAEADEGTGTASALSAGGMKSETFPLPESRALCLIYCKTSNVFSSHRHRKTNEEEADWFPACVENVTWYKCQDEARVDVRCFDQTSVSVEYKHTEALRSKEAANDQDFQMLIPVLGSSTAYRTAWSSDVFFDRDPTGVRAGDWVQVLFQNGQALPPNAWFTGRVADVRINTLGGYPVCDILYDDGDYETNVPVSSRFVHILRRGWDYPDWMIGLSLEHKKGKNSKQTCAIIQNVTPRGNVEVLIEDIVRKERRVETKSYQDVVNILMTTTVQKVQPNRKHQWIGESPKTVKSTETCEKKIETRTFVEHPVSKQTWDAEGEETTAVELPDGTDAIADYDGPDASHRAARGTRLKRATKPKESSAHMKQNQRACRRARRDDTSGKENSMPSGSTATVKQSSSVFGKRENVIADRIIQPCTGVVSSWHSTQSKKPKSDQPQKGPVPKEKGSSVSATLSKRRRARNERGGNNCSFEQVTTDAMLVSMEIYSPEEGEKHISASGRTCETKDLAPALEKALEKSLHSCDTQLGAEMLTYMSIQYDKSPSWEICQTLVKLFLCGPTSGKTTFPDCQRLELAEEYVQLCLARNSKMYDRFIETAGPSLWTDVLHSILSPHYVIEGDENRTTNFALSRVAQSVHVKACCAEFFLQMLKYQLGGSVGAIESNTTHDDALFERKLIKDIVGHRRGPKEALEKFWKALVSQWIILGHFVDGQLSGLVHSEANISDDSLHFLQEQSLRLLKLLGKITSYLAWLFAAVEKENPMGVAHMLYNTASHSLDSSEFDPSPFIGGDIRTTEKHWSNIRLRLALDLDKGVIPEVRPILADLMGVGGVFNIIFAF
ncbi:hypothetical protein ACA910_022444 [Epithemia clementina (nom. ined.)]